MPNSNSGAAYSFQERENMLKRRQVSANMQNRGMPLHLP